MDLLSLLAEKIQASNPSAYELLVVGGGTPVRAHEWLNGIKADQLFAKSPPSSAAAQTVLAGFWLWLDGLDECHRIVQNSPDEKWEATYAFWHAIMHRREGDFSNSKYWYARAGEHPVFKTLAAQPGGWSAGALVDLVREVHQKPDDPRYKLAVKMQKLEWETLMEYCAAPK
jgi:hypothetical protein